MLPFSLVFMLQEWGPRQNTPLMADIIKFGVVNSTILNQDRKTKILSQVACFYWKCLAKIVFWRAASWLLSHLLPGDLFAANDFIREILFQHISIFCLHSTVVTLSKPNPFVDRHETLQNRETSLDKSKSKPGPKEKEDQRISSREQGKSCRKWQGLVV